jgi:RNA polymerase sigma-70 factor (ECF subfamily)
MTLLSLLRGSRDFETRIEAQRAALFRAASAWSHDRALADDLAQETLARALAHAGQLRDPERLRSWLFGILANCWRDHLRALRPSVDIDTVEEECFGADPTPEEAYDRREIVARVRAAVARRPRPGTGFCCT